MASNCARHVSNQARRGRPLSPTALDVAGVSFCVVVAVLWRVAWNIKPFLATRRACWLAPLVFFFAQCPKSHRRAARRGRRRPCRGFQATVCIKYAHPLNFEAPASTEQGGFCTNH